MWRAARGAPRRDALLLACEDEQTKSRCYGSSILATFTAEDGTTTEQVMAAINTYNYSENFGRAYLDPEGTISVRMYIIADGGIRSHGDIAKSIRFGASMVMIGSLFAGHEESPGQTVEINGERFKEYYGSASDFNKGEYKHVEGKRILEPIKGRLADTLIEMEQDVQSSISYAGGTKLMDVRKVNYVILGGDNAGEHLLM
jgi:hypothetical protein